MRIDSLGLRRFGPFTDVTLDFSGGDGGLHVVYGDNEAGKSSALRALRAALFGIEARTTDDFVHRYSELRLSMTLCNADGGALSFVRRKANRDALRDRDDDAPLPADALRSFLGGVDAPEFERVFGLDHVRLREGSDRLLDEDALGAGAAIVGAALGVSDLRGVRQRIDEEASELFRSRASKPEINRAIREWQDLRRALREQSVSSQAWDEAKRSAKRSEDERDEANRRVERLERERADLEFLRRNRPRIERLKAQRAALEQVKDAPDLDETFVERHRDAEQALVKAQARLDVERESERSYRAELEALEPRPGAFALLDHADEIEAFRAQAGVVEKANADTETLLGELVELKERRRRIAGEAGIGPKDGDPDDEDLPYDLDGQDGLGRSDSLDRLGGPERPDGLHPLDRAIRAARRLGDPDEEVRKRRVELDDLNREIGAGLKSLPGFSGTIEDLPARPVPGSVALAEFRKRYEDIEKEERQACEAEEAFHRQRREITGEIETLSEGGAVPSINDLKGARERRDAKWRLVRRAWVGGESVDEEARKLDGERPLHESFERSVEEGDRIADLMQRESDRVARVAERKRQRERVDRDLEALAHAGCERGSRRGALEDEWRAAWGDSGLEVHGWARMQDAMNLRERLLEKFRRREALVAEIATLERRIASAHGDLRSALAAAGAPVDGGRELSPLLERAEEWHGALTKAKRRLAELRTERREKEIRIRQMRRDREHLEERVPDFHTRHARDLPDAPVAIMVRRLVERLERVKQEKQTYDEGRNRLDQAVRKRKRADENAKTSAGVLDTLKREAGAPSVDEIHGIERRAMEKRSVLESIGATEADLLTEGCSIEETEGRVASREAMELGELESRVGEIESELLEARTTANAKREASAVQRQAFEAMGAGSEAAAKAWESMAQVEAEIDASVRRYVRLVFASHLLGEAVERYRGSHEAPLLKLASGRLADLTGGRYERIETDVDSKGKPFFLVRETGRDGAKTLAALSDGTRDQLQLALVLGALEHRIASGAQPMPLILDDVLVHFDDERSLAALEALAKFSRRNQVLLFTHHSRIREQAEYLRASRPDDNVFVQSL